MKIITTLIDNDFLSIEYLSELEMLKTNWKQESLTMSDEDFITQMNHLIEYINIYKPPYFLANTTNMQYTIPPKLQEWNNNTLFPAFERAKLKKLAIIVSEDIFTRVSVEQIIDGNSEPAFATSYFDKELSGLDWLFE